MSLKTAYRRNVAVGLVFDKTGDHVYVYRHRISGVLLDWMLPRWAHHGEIEDMSKLTALVREGTGKDDIFWTRLSTIVYEKRTDHFWYTALDCTSAAFATPDLDMRAVALTDLWLVPEIDMMQHAMIMAARHSLRTGFVMPFTVMTSEKPTITTLPHGYRSPLKPVAPPSPKVAERPTAPSKDPADKVVSLFDYQGAK